MRYLFFDIECCDGENICEFGYVITDEKFQTLKVTEETLSAMEMPKVAKESKNNESRRNCYSTGQVATTLGDIMRRQGIDLNKKI